MEKEYLVDTNIFLEVLLSDERSEECKKFLKDNIDKIYISDFSLHSIGVILFRFNKEDVFVKFCEDMCSIPIIGLSMDEMTMVSKAKKRYGLDFDDAYQYTIAKLRQLSIKTMDRDFDGTDIDIV